MAATQPVLNLVTVVAPCSARWEDMGGDDRVRFCGHCRQHVFNLSGMTRAEAEALIAEKKGRLCGRYYRRADGTVMTRDCMEERYRQYGKRVALAVGVSMALLTALFTSLVTVAYGPSQPPARRGILDLEPMRTIMSWLRPAPAPRTMVMGEICVPRSNQAAPPPAMQDD